MKKQEFAENLCEYMDTRISEICKKFANGNTNGASLYAFWIGLSLDIQSFLEKNRLRVVKK